MVKSIEPPNGPLTDVSKAEKLNDFRYFYINRPCLIRYLDRYYNIRIREYINPITHFIYVYIMGLQKPSNFLTLSFYSFKSYGYELLSIEETSKVLRYSLTLVAQAGGVGWLFMTSVLGWRV